MANYLKSEKKIMALNALVEGSSIRAAARMAGIHKDTLMRLALRSGKAAQRYMDKNLRNLSCEHVQIDEIWGFVGKKAKNVKPDDDLDKVGDIYCFSAIDQESKLVPCFKLGNRDKETILLFMQDLADRMSKRIQLSSDGLAAFFHGAVAAFGENVDYGQVVKSYEVEPRQEGRYSPPQVTKAERRWMIGLPMRDRISTSHIERQNLTIRTFVRRMTRLTCAFSKKHENHEAALALHFLHYNFVREHGTIKTTPAVACGIAYKPWTMGDILEMTDGS